MVQSYLPGGANWRHLANTIELVLPSAYLSPQPKGQIDRFSRLKGISTLKNISPKINIYDK